MDAAPQGEPGIRHRWQRLELWLFGVLVLAAVIGTVLHLGELEHIAGLATAAQPLWLIAGLLLQGLTYVSAAQVWHAVLATSGYPRTLRSLIPLGVAKLFADQSMPSAGMSGTAFFVAALSRRGVPAAVCFTTLVVSVIAYYAVYLLMAVAVLGLLWLHHAVEPWIVALVAPFVVLAPVIPVLLFWLARHGKRSLPAWLGRIPGAARWQTYVETSAGPVRIEWRALLGAAWPHAAVFLLDAATLWVVLEALGDPAGPTVALAAFILGSIAATLGPVPLGLGTFEATCVAVLVLLGVQLETALAATLLFRGLTLWLPMFPGLWLSRRELASRR